VPLAAERVVRLAEPEIAKPDVGEICRGCSAAGVRASPAPKNASARSPTREHLADVAASEAVPSTDA
jgi:hypothetical protein